MSDTGEQSKKTPGTVLGDAFERLTGDAITRINKGITDTFTALRRSLSTYLDQKSTDFKAAETASQTLLQSANTLKAGLTTVSGTLQEASSKFTASNTGILPQLSKQVEELATHTARSKTDLADATTKLQKVTDQFAQPTTGIVDQLGNTVAGLEAASDTLQKGLGAISADLQKVTSAFEQPDGVVGQLDKRIELLEGASTQLKGPLNTSIAELHNAAQRFTQPGTGIIAQLQPQVKAVEVAAANLTQTTTALQKTSQSISDPATGILRQLDDKISWLKQNASSNPRAGLRQAAFWVGTGLLLSSGIYFLYAQRQANQQKPNSNTDVTQQLKRIRELADEKKAAIADRERQQQEYWPRPWYSHISRLRDEAQLLRQELAQLTLQEQLLVAGVTAETANEPSYAKKSLTPGTKL